MDENVNVNGAPNMPPEPPENGKATASMVLGIIAVVLMCTGYGGMAGVVCGIIGLVLANKAKVAGNVSGTRKAGFVLSLIGTIGGAVTFVVSIACVACAGAAVGGTLSYLGY